jgi:hypothetical protein
VIPPNARIVINNNVPITHFNFHFVEVGDNSNTKINVRHVHKVISHAVIEIVVNLLRSKPNVNAAEILKKGCFL